MKCKTCNGRRWVLDPDTRHYAGAKPCAACECDNCEDVGWVFSRNETSGLLYSEPCPVCAPQHRRMKLYNYARIPARNRASTFRNYRVQGDRSLAEAQQWFLTRASEWQPGDTGLILSGPVGTGKTHLMCAWLRMLTLRHGIGCRFIEFSHLLRDIKAGYDAGQSDATILKRLVEVPVLVIDELGKAIETEWQRSILDQLISQRYNRKGSTFATTNYRLNVAPGRGASRAADDFHVRTLGDVAGGRIASRLMEMCDVVEVSAPDFRQGQQGGRDAHS